MIFFKLLSFLFVPYNKLLIDSDKSIKGKYDGNCRLINLNDTAIDIKNTNIDDEKLLIKIRENYRKKNILDKLQSDLSIINKVTIAENFLNENSTYGYNINAGGLFKDWDFEL
jgi:hypothetical protein